MENKYDVIQLAKQFLADHDTLGFYKTYDKYYMDDSTWKCGRYLFTGKEAILRTISAMDYPLKRPYSKMDILNMVKIDEHTVYVHWIEHTYNRDDGRIAYAESGENLFSGTVVGVLTFEGEKLRHVTSFYDTLPYRLPEAMPAQVNAADWAELSPHLV